MSLTLRSFSYKKLETWKSLSRMPNGNYKNHVWCRTFKPTYMKHAEKIFKEFAIFTIFIEISREVPSNWKSNFLSTLCPQDPCNRSWFFCTTIQMTDSVKTKKCCQMVRWLLSLASKKLNRLPLAGSLKFNTRCILYLPPYHTSQLTVEVLTSTTKQKLAQSIKMAYWIVHCFARVWMMIHLFYKFCSS